MQTAMRVMAFPMIETQTTRPGETGSVPPAEGRRRYAQGQLRISTPPNPRRRPARLPAAFQCRWSAADPGPTRAPRMYAWLWHWLGCIKGLARAGRCACEGQAGDQATPNLIRASLAWISRRSRSTSREARHTVPEGSSIEIDRG